MAANCILLLGAGFSRNWGGRLATEVTADLTSRLQDNPQLPLMLNRMNFEDVLARVQAEYLHSRSGETEKRLKLMQGAISGVFQRMNEHFERREFEFSNNLAHSIRKFLVRFDAIFTLNQDLLLEPIREVLESDESDVFHCWALDSLESARCGSLNTALRRTAVAFVTRAI